MFLLFLCISALNANELSMHIDTNGVDIGQCKSQKPSMTLDDVYSECIRWYAEECDDEDEDDCVRYQGFIIEIGEGVYNLTDYLSTDSGEYLQIHGKGAKSTILEFTGSSIPWLGCYSNRYTHQRCNITISNITLISTHSKTLWNKNQILLNGKGQIIFDNVIFENNDHKWAMVEWLFSGFHRTVLFKNCVFRQHRGTYYFMDGVNATFINCTFENYHVDHSIFEIDNYAKILFENCSFRNNSISGGWISPSIFHVQHGSILRFTATKFVENKILSGYMFKLQYNSSLFLNVIQFGHSISSSNKISIANSYIHGNNFANSFLFFEKFIDSYIGSKCVIYIKNTTFNHVRGMILRCSVNILNSKFLNGTHVWPGTWSRDVDIFNSEISISAGSDINIKNTIYGGYTVFIDANNISNNNSIVFDNVTMYSTHRSMIHVKPHDDDENYQFCLMEILNSKFYQTEQLHLEKQPYQNKDRCISLDGKMQYIIKNTTFQNCSVNKYINSYAAALYVYNPANNSIFESLTFIDNYAKNHSADFYINVSSDVIINGSWYISGSKSNNVPSSSYFDYSSNKNMKRLVMRNWIIENTTNHPVLYFENVHFCFDNLTAINNEKSVINVKGQGYNYKIIDSTFIRNGGIINGSNVSESVLVMYDCIARDTHIAHDKIFDVWLNITRGQHEVLTSVGDTSQLCDEADDPQLTYRSHQYPINRDKWQKPIKKQRATKTKSGIKKIDL